MEIRWFKNNHEQRNDLLRFGLMRLHTAKQLRYSEFPLQHCVRFGFGEDAVKHTHRHTSLILVQDGTTKVKCLVDSEDSFFWMCPLIASVDRYFCAGYNSEFFENKQFIQPYAWQTDQETRYYRRRTTELVEAFGCHFTKVKRFIPISPSLGNTRSLSWLERKLCNAKHKIHTALFEHAYWEHEMLDYEERYAKLLQLREQPLLYDVVLSDTLWGWPRHRVKLHSKLHRMRDKYRIYSSLNWSEPVPHDGSALSPLKSTDFPMKTRDIADYERMLSSSRLGVYATGFHWGWRSIMALALMIGIPVYMDKPVLEPWFEMSEFTTFWNEDGNWDDLEKHLTQIGELEWHKIKSHNQRTYDKLMSPEQVARYFIAVALQ